MWSWSLQWLQGSLCYGAWRTSLTSFLGPLCSQLCYFLSHFFPHCSSTFSLFVNSFPLRCPHLGCWAQPCPVGAGQNWPSLAPGSPNRGHLYSPTTANTLTYTSNTHPDHSVVVSYHFNLMVYTLLDTDYA